MFNLDDLASRWREPRERSSDRDRGGEPLAELSRASGCALPRIRPEAVALASAREPSGSVRGCYRRSGGSPLRPNRRREDASSRLDVRAGGAEPRQVERSNRPTGIEVFSGADTATLCSTAERFRSIRGCSMRSHRDGWRYPHVRLLVALLSTQWRRHPSGARWYASTAAAPVPEAVRAAASDVKSPRGRWSMRDDPGVTEPGRRVQACCRP